MIPLCPLQQPGHHSPLTDVFSLLPPLLSPSSLLPSLPPSPPSSLPLLPVTPPPLSATLQLFVDADNAHFRTEMVEYKRKQTITRAKQVPLTVAEQCTLSVLQCNLSVLQYTVMYYNISIHTSYNTSPPLPHPPPPPPPFSLPLPQVSLEGGAGVLAPASSEETLVESAAVPSATQPNTGLKNVCSPERMQVGEGEQYFSVLEDPTMQVVRPLSRGCQLFGGPLLVGVLLLRPNHVALCPGSPPLLVEVLLYFIVLETQPCSLVASFPVLHRSYRRLQYE